MRKSFLYTLVVTFAFLVAVQSGSALLGGADYHFVANVPSAEVYIDGSFYGYTPCDAHFTTGTIDSTTHTAYARKEGYYDTEVITLPTTGGTIPFTLVAKPAPTTGTLTISSSPSGALVYVDGRFYGQTPDTVPNLAVGYHDVLLQKEGFNDWTATVYINAGQTKSEYATLQRSVQYGTLVVGGYPTGTQVHVDGIYKGQTTPWLTLEGITAGVHHLEMTKAGYQEYDIDFTIQAGKTTTIEKSLDKIPEPKTGTLLVSTPTPGKAEVYMDAVFQGYTPYGSGDMVIHDVNPGTHTITLRLEGYTDAEKAVKVNAGETVSVSLTLTPIQPEPSKTGSLAVNSGPSGASIYLNNELKGITPLTIKDLAPGTYSVVLKLEGYQDWSAQATVNAGETTTISGDLSAVPPTTQSAASPLAVIGALCLGSLGIALRGRRR